MGEGDHELNIMRAELAESKKLLKELIAHHDTLRWNTFWTCIGALSGVSAILLAVAVVLTR